MAPIIELLFEPIVTVLAFNMLSTQSSRLLAFRPFARATRALQQQTYPGPNTEYQLAFITSIPCKIRKQLPGLTSDPILLSGKQRNLLSPLLSSCLGRSLKMSGFKAGTYLSNEEAATVFAQGRSLESRVDMLEEITSYISANELMNFGKKFAEYYQNRGNNFGRHHPNRGREEKTGKAKSSTDLRTTRNLMAHSIHVQACLRYIHKCHEPTTKSQLEVLFKIVFGRSSSEVESLLQLEKSKNIEPTIERVLNLYCDIRRQGIDAPDFYALVKAWAGVLQELPKNRLLGSADVEFAANKAIKDGEARRARAGKNSGSYKDWQHLVHILKKEGMMKEFITVFSEA